MIYTISYSDNAEETLSISQVRRKLAKKYHDVEKALEALHETGEIALTFSTIYFYEELPAIDHAMPVDSLHDEISSRSID